MIGTTAELQLCSISLSSGRDEVVVDRVDTATRELDAGADFEEVTEGRKPLGAKRAAVEIAEVEEVEVAVRDQHIAVDARVFAAHREVAQ